ncbi:hypothetical protein H1P_1770003 [Hyella patelloides LEGE 07179]|uniref:Uncharacterized protein n=1 Tax=Hyella patelloides LEGE 07179 TaxID=945734 RepID=A0A563VNF5_9CYAN|nr:hypothetical protein H1P_1770003 [Hyella patelloides LEGE 07179]
MVATKQFAETRTLLTNISWQPFKVMLHGLIRSNSHLWDTLIPCFLDYINHSHGNYNLRFRL